MKGKDFSKIIAWYKLVYKNISQLIFLLNNEIDQVRHTLDVLKCGLFSKNAEVANLCCRVLTKLVQSFNENSNMVDFK